MKLDIRTAGIVIATSVFTFGCAQPPTASFTVDPPIGNTDTVFTFDASGSSDPKDPAEELQVRWDWEGDGAWDTNYDTTKIVQHSYNAVGTKTITLEVRNITGIVTTITKNIEIVEFEIKDTIVFPGKMPMALSVNSNLGNIYIADYENDSVLIVSELTRQLVAELGAGNHPSCIAVNPETNAVYVGITGDNVISVIDGASNVIIDTIMINDAPMAIAVDEIRNLVYLGAVNASNAVLYVIDGAVNEVIDTTIIGEYPGEIAVTVRPELNLVYAVHGTKLYVVDGMNLNINYNISFSGNALSISVDLDSKKVYIGLGDAFWTYGKLIAIDEDSREIVNESMIGIDPANIIVDPNRGCVYVACTGGLTVESGVYIIEPRNCGIIGYVDMGEDSSLEAMAFNHSSGNIYVTEPGTRSVKVINIIEDL